MTINECRGARAKKVYARAIKDYEIEWMKYTIPKGTIVLLEIYAAVPDILYFYDGAYIYMDDLNEFFEPII